MDRKELKRRARAVYSKYKYEFFVVGILMMLATITVTSEVSLNDVGESMNIMKVNIGVISIPVGAALALSGFLVACFGGFITILLTNPLKVGEAYYYLHANFEKPSYRDLLKGFEDYAHVVVVKLLTELKVVLFTLLLIVPGIIKSYEYRLVDFILAEHKGMKAGDAQQLSAEMMWGHKMETFMLDLSFLGWGLLAAIASAFTLGLANALYTPYKKETDAQLYLWLKETNDPSEYTVQVQEVESLDDDVVDEVAKELDEELAAE